MPKVTVEHLAARRAQVLDAARRCFVRNGFHATSMQQIFEESGLSAGAVYRYFASKEDMILAIADEGMDEVLEVMRAMTDAPPAFAGNGSLGAAVAAAIEAIEQREQQGGAGALAIQVWSEALRNPVVAEQFRDKLQSTRGGLERLVERLQEQGRLPREVTASALGNVIAALIPGYLVQRTLLGAQGVHEFSDALRALWP